MVLTRDAILGEIDLGRVAITPFDREQVGPASVDLHLGDEIRVFEAGGPIELATIDHTTISQLQRFNDGYALAPGETIHGITRERVKLPSDIAGWLEGRSRYARLGLLIHVSAGFVCPGVDNHQVLEISNLGGRALVLRPGLRLCQIILQRCEGSASYVGRFSTQTRP